MKKVIEIEVSYAEDDGEFVADGYVLNGISILTGDLEEAIQARLQEMEKDTEERIR